MYDLLRDPNRALTRREKVKNEEEKKKEERISFDSTILLFSYRPGKEEEEAKENPSDASLQGLLLLLLLSPILPLLAPQSRHYRLSPLLLGPLRAFPCGGGRRCLQRRRRRPQSPGCSNKFQLVKVKSWVNGTESTTFVGLSARFGATLPSQTSEAQKHFAVLANPFDCCANLSSKLTSSVALAKRGDCTFTDKAKVAQSGGAAGLLVINEDEELYKMVCTENDTSINVTIPVVMIPKSAGDKLMEFMANGGGNVKVLLYSPNRPVDEHYDQLTRKDGPDTRTRNREASEKEVLEINTKGAVIFVIAASAFLLLLFYLMSSWFVWLLIVLFCIGGTEGMHVCLVTLLSRILKDCGQTTINLPIFGEVLMLSLGFYRSVQPLLFFGLFFDMLHVLGLVKISLVSV
uniref:PA domain-containing protein n=1 Tax=Ananas comosus var. bracteatus TaxID=296719 RepID=A0A6V7NNY0_ANACO|nr:unnamed protein product [Ananas comosus var. bracteatus]